jgi:hypothetical protein
MKSKILFGFLILFSSVNFAQQIKYSGTHPPNPDVLKLMERDTEIFDKYREVSIRDSLRKEIISPEYFYHGIDGKPIDIDGLTKRQTKNQFQLMEEEVLGETLYQYENSAILVYTVKLKIKDKGEIHDRYRSNLMVFSKENGEWKIISDIVGQDPTIEKK